MLSEPLVYAPGVYAGVFTAVGDHRMRLRCIRVDM